MMEILKNKTMIGFIIFVFAVVGIESYSEPAAPQTTEMLVTEDHIVYENEYMAQNK